tara:strand:- start:242 stop:442 length:201 start_codon:yes stop_codon:yes gene_type:complete
VTVVAVVVRVAGVTRFAKVVHEARDNVGIVAGKAFYSKNLFAKENKRKKVGMGRKEGHASIQVWLR